MRPAPLSPARSRMAFTMVELMVSTALVAAIMLLLLGTVDQTQQIWQRTSAKAVQFQTARFSFETMARRLSQATLNTYWRPHDLNTFGAKADYLYRRQSELHFLSGPTSKIFGSPALPGAQTPVEKVYPLHGVFFQAPLGHTTEPEQGAAERLRFRSMDHLLTACGYFVEYGEDPERPDFLTDALVPPKRRFRLMELVVPGERLTIFQRPRDPPENIEPLALDRSNRSYVGMVDVNREPTPSWVRPRWMEEAMRERSGDKPGFAYTRPMADNVIGLIILPKLPVRDRERADALELAPNFQYDSWRILRGEAATPSNPAGPARDHLLPPIVQVIMIAVDELSAQRVARASKEAPQWMEGLFERVNDESDLQEDLFELEKRLVEDPARLNFRIFTTDVVIRGAKWSRDP